MADTLRPNTLRNYRSYIENHIRPSLGDEQLARLTPKDIQRFYEKLGGSLASGTLKICRTVYREDGGGLTAGDTKTSAGTRKIVLPLSTASLLSKRKASALTEWIFPNPLRPEQPVNPGSAYRRLKVLLKQAGLPSIRFHDLRHTCAIIFVQNWPVIGRYSYICGDLIVRYKQICGQIFIRKARKTCFWCARDIRG